MNQLKNYVLMAAGFAVLVMTVGVFAAGPAIAQAVRAALVSNVDDPGRIPYRFVSSCVFNGAFCAVDLPPVLSGKRLVITHVSGELSENLPGGTLIEARLLVPARDFAFLPLTYTGSQQGLDYFVVDQQELIFVLAGEQPTVSVVTGGTPTSGSIFQVTVTGYMLDCNAGPCAAIQP